MVAVTKSASAALESTIQRRIIERYKKDGWMVVKIGLCNLPGFPDLMLLRNGTAVFVEVKRPGCKPRPLQQYRIEQLRRAGFDAVVMTE